VSGAVGRRVPYRSRMPRAVGLLCFLAVQAVLGAALLTLLLGILTSFDPVEMSRARAEGDFWRGGAIVFAIASTLQVAVLLPVRRRRPRRARGAPVWVSLGAASLLVGLLVGAFVIAALDAFFKTKDEILWIGPTVTLVAWSAAALLFRRMFEKSPDASREDLLLRMTRAILKGTAFEVVALVPLDVMIRRRESCYCAAGTLLGWAVSFAVGLVVLGPAVLLPLLAKQRERWYAERCTSCATPFALAESPLAAAGYREPTVQRCVTCGIRVPLQLPRSW
jgi:hypothetical protein